MNNKEAIEQLKQIPINPEASDEYIKTIYQAIDKAIKALEDKQTGKWINQDEGSQYPMDCSVCHNEPFCDDYGYVLTNYCPHCGTKMEAENE